MSRPVGHVSVWSAAIVSLLLAAPAGATPLVRVSSMDRPLSTKLNHAGPKLLGSETLPRNPSPTIETSDLGAERRGRSASPFAPKGVGRLDSSKTFLAALPGAEITLLELTECPGSTCDTVHIWFDDEEPAMRTSRIESLVKFHPPADDSDSGESNPGLVQWLEWLDDFTEGKNDAGFPSLVLGAFGVFGIWLARLKRPRPM